MASAQTSKDIRHKLDFYPTPEFYTRALNLYLPFEVGESVLCPFAGNGAIVRALDPGLIVSTNDVKNYGYPLTYNLDLSDLDNYSKLPKVNWVIDNPPYNLIKDVSHIEKLYSLANKGLCLLLRQTWYSGGTGQTGTSKRGQWLAQNPASLKITLPRYPFANNSKTGKPQTDACAHEWVCWFKNGYVPPVANPVITSKELSGWKWRYNA